MKIRALLERVSSKAFHAIDYAKLVKVLKDNEIELDVTNKSRLKNKVVNVEKYPYYLSLARTMNSGYVKGSVDEGSAVIEFNGDKLSDNFKGKAVDWYGGLSQEERRKKTSYYIDGEKRTDDYEFHRYYEAQDRLYSAKKSKIINVRKYITAIHAVYSEDAKTRGYYEIIKKKSGGAPLYLYATTQDLLSMKKSKLKKI